MAIDQYLSGINNATAGQKADVNTASADLGALQTGAGALPAKLKEALNLKLNNNKDIINQQSSTMENYFNSGAVAREKYQDVFNPFEKAKLVQQDRSMALRPYDTLSGVLENRMGTVADTVTAGVQGWQGMVDAGQTKLQLAQSNLTNALAAYSQATNMQQNEDQMNYNNALQQESKRQFGITSGQNQQQIDNQASQWLQSFNKPSGSGSGDSIGGTSDISALLGLLGLGGETPTTTDNNQMTEPQPTNIPRNSAIQYHSPKGQWEYNWNYKAWVPAGSEVTQ